MDWQKNVLTEASIGNSFPYHNDRMGFLIQSNLCPTPNDRVIVDYCGYSHSMQFHIRHRFLYCNAY